LSLTLCTGYLRSLEESERTRKANLTPSQALFPYFYPEKTELLKKINTLAFELGGELRPVRLGWKFDLIRRLFGWKTAKKVMPNLRKLRLAAIVKWDEMMYRISASSVEGSKWLGLLPIRSKKWV